MSRDTGRDGPGIGTRNDDDDDEALTWGASNDTSYVEGPTVTADEQVVALDADNEDDELPPGVLSSTMLVVHGIFAAILLLYVVAWLKSIGSVAPSFDSPLADWMWRIGTWFAVASPAVWFAGVLLLVPTDRSRRRVLALLLGVGLLLPWPFLIGVFA